MLEPALNRCVALCLVAECVDLAEVYFRAVASVTRLSTAFDMNMLLCKDASDTVHGGPPYERQRKMSARIRAVMGDRRRFDRPRFRNRLFVFVPKDFVSAMFYYNNRWRVLDCIEWTQDLGPNDWAVCDYANGVWYHYTLD